MDDCEYPLESGGINWWCEPHVEKKRNDLKISKQKQMRFGKNWSFMDVFELNWLYIHNFWVIIWLTNQSYFGEIVTK
jgi:hypothetical protein